MKVNAQTLKIIDSLKKVCEGIETVDPTGPAYTAMLKFMNGQDTKFLAYTMTLKIKWLSYEAEKIWVARTEKEVNEILERGVVR